MIQWGKLSQKEIKQMLEDLGLEFRHTAMGGRYVFPKHVKEGK